MSISSTAVIQLSQQTDAQLRNLLLAMRLRHVTSYCIVCDRECLLPSNESNERNDRERPDDFVCSACYAVLNDADFVSISPTGVWTASACPVHMAVYLGLIAEIDSRRVKPPQPATALTPFPMAAPHDVQ
jgi:hypothetical protein